LKAKVETVKEEIDSLPIPESSSSEDETPKMRRRTPRKK
jgi:hypothetical protein